jgi:hypothetical protein
MNPATQSATDAHAVLQAFPEHAYGAHDMVTPSIERTVWPSVHVDPVAHWCDVGSQIASAAQSFVVVQVSLQLVAPHANGSHAWVIAAPPPHVPFPPHTDAAVSIPFTHDPLPHVTSDPT